MSNVELLNHHELYKHVNCTDVAIEAKAMEPRRVSYKEHGLIVICHWWNIVSEDPKDWTMIASDNIFISNERRNEWKSIAFLSENGDRWIKRQDIRDEHLSSKDQ